MRKNPTIEDYIRLGEMCRSVREQLFEIATFSYDTFGAPKKVVRRIYSASDSIDRFRNDMECRLYVQNPCLPKEATQIFYPRGGEPVPDDVLEILRQIKL